MIMIMSKWIKENNNDNNNIIIIINFNKIFLGFWFSAK